MSILHCRNCGVDISGEPLFRQVTFGIEKGEKVGLVGPNGAGKTTLLKACLGEYRLESGQIHLTGTFGYLPQKPLLEEEGTVWERMLDERSDLIDIRNQLRNLEKRMADEPDDKVFEQYSVLTESFERQGGYALEAQIRKILSGIGLGDHMNAEVEKLSGGQKTRLALSKLLLRSPDLLVLDEPTNHLDMEALEWLEGFLKGYPGAILLVSHDRYFLDNVVQKMLHLENGMLKSYPGNFSEYELQRAVEEVTMAKEAERVNRKIALLEEYIRRNKAGVHAKQARGRETQLQKIKPVQTTKSQKEMHISLATGRRSGDRTLMIDDLSVSFPEKTLFQEVHLELRRGDRVALLGNNGIGKTTFLKAIMGKVPYKGQIRLGANVKLGYYSQEHEELTEKGSILDEIREVSSLKDSEIRSLLARFGFVGEDIFKLVKVLSGGEKSRLALAKLFLMQGNLLLLDEPTNHLDTNMRDVLEEALQDYDGTLLIVSHDRYFLDRMVNQIASLTSSGLELFDGDYSTYKAKIQLEHEQDLEESKKETKSSQKVQNNREDRQKTKRIGQLEKQIASLEEEIEDLKQKLSEVESDYQKALELHNEYEEKGRILDETMTEWLELTEE